MVSLAAAASRRTLGLLDVEEGAQPGFVGELVPACQQAVEAEHEGTLSQLDISRCGHCRLLCGGLQLIVEAQGVRVNDHVAQARVLGHLGAERHGAARLGPALLEQLPHTGRVDEAAGVGVGERHEAEAGDYDASARRHLVRPGCPEHRAEGCAELRAEAREVEVVADSRPARSWWETSRCSSSSCRPPAHASTSRRVRVTPPPSLPQ
jgi:hypothetical protein